MSDPFTLLVVEDDPGTIALIRLALSSAGIHIYVTSSGDDALKLVNEIKPDLVIMDLLLPKPGMRGAEVIATLKHNPATKEIPVIAVSAGGYEFIEKAMSAGSNEYLTKPFQVKDLRELVSRYIQQTIN
jgi:CheY-like chemotaxis protein